LGTCIKLRARISERLRRLPKAGAERFFGTDSFGVTVAGRVGDFNVLVFADIANSQPAVGGLRA
jgi:hypothetical protein